MKVLVVGGTGTIGSALVELLNQEHQVICVGNSSGEYTVDIDSKESISRLFDEIGKVDAIVSVTGKGEFGRFNDESDSGYELVWQNKVMGQINLVRVGMQYLNSGGSITLTSGQASNKPFPGTAAISMGCAALNAFVATAAMELQNDQRINVVSPDFVKETMLMMGMDSEAGIAAQDVAKFYLRSIQGEQSGQVFNAVKAA